MASPNDNVSMAVFCDFENVALGVRDAKYEKFDIKPVLERLLLKGSIVVKKAYCDWDRYKGFKATMHEANFELIEIPHVRQSGKNSADIRLVVDALDLCYTKSHVNTFVIISGDSDFSPLVSKLRENAKQVIGVGVKQSTSDLLIANCDEFIFYDDLVREIRRAAAKSEAREAQPAVKRAGADGKGSKDELEARRSQAIEMAVETFDALVSERGDGGKIWASVLKNAIKRRKPDFSESYYGFRTFGGLLEEAHARGLLQFGRDEKSSAFVYRSSAADSEPVDDAPSVATAPAIASAVSEAKAPEKASRNREPRHKGRGGRNQESSGAEAHAQPVAQAIPEAQAQPAAQAIPEAQAVDGREPSPVDEARTGDFAPDAREASHAAEAMGNPPAEARMDEAVPVPEAEGQVKDSVREAEGRRKPVKRGPGARIAKRGGGERPAKAANEALAVEPSAPAPAPAPVSATLGETAADESAAKPAPRPRRPRQAKAKLADGFLDGA